MRPRSPAPPAGDAAPRADADASSRRARALSALWEQSATAMFLADRLGLVVDANPGFLERVGESYSSVIGSPLDRWFESHPIEGALSERITGLWHQPGDELWRGEIVIAGELACALAGVHRFPGLDAGGDQALAIGFLTDTGDAAPTATKYRVADRLATVGRLAGSAAHEIKNDLGPLLGYLSLLEDEDREGMVSAMRESVRRVQAQVEQILAPLRPRAHLRGPVLLARAIEDALARIRRAGRLRRVHLVQEIDDDAVVFADKAELDQLVVDLVTNALDALGDGGGSTRGSLRIEVSAARGWAILVVEDSGAGIPQSVRARALEPFVSTKGSLGAGLGLPAVYEIVRSLAGRLSIAPGVDSGTRVRVELRSDEGGREEGRA